MVAQALKFAVDIYRPCAVICTGYCGSLSTDGPGVGDIAVATSVLTPEEDTIHTADTISEILVAELRQCIDQVVWDHMAKPNVRTGPFITTSHFVSSREDADQLLQMGALFVEQEAYEIVKACRTLGLPVGVAKVVRDIPGISVGADRARLGKAICTAAIIEVAKICDGQLASGTA